MTNLNYVCFPNVLIENIHRFERKPSRLFLLGILIVLLGIVSVWRLLFGFLFSFFVEEGMKNMFYRLKAEGKSKELFFLREIYTETTFVNLMKNGSLEKGIFLLSDYGDVEIQN